MGLALERVSGQMMRFGEEMGAIAPDVEGLAVFGSALGDLVAEGWEALESLTSVLELGAGIAQIFSQDVFSPLSEGAALAVGHVEALFDRMGGEIERTFHAIGQDAVVLGASLPGYFAGPLREIAGMFVAMAASARASMNSVAGSANAALQAVSAVSGAAGGGSVSASLQQSGGSAVSVLAASEGEGLGIVEPQMHLLAASDFEGAYLSEPEMSLFAMPDREVLSLPEPEVYLSNAPSVMTPPPAVAVTVYNENYIGSEVDVEAVLREMEVRLVDAVASSMEGVYA